MLHRTVAMARRAIASLGRIPTLLVCLAALATAVMYCGNDLYDKEPDAPRGDGRYRPVMARGDGHMHFLITRSVVFDRDFDFDNDLARFGDPWAQPRTVTGRKNVMQQIGPSLIWAPVLATAHVFSKVANVFGADVPSHGYTMFHQRILYATSVLFAWLAIVLAIAVARRHVGGRWGPAWGGIAVLLGTSLTYYATFMPSYAHAMDSAVVAAFLAYWAWSLGELRWRRFVILGVLLGIAAMVRVQDVGFGVVVALELVPIAVRAIRDEGAARGVAVIVRGGLVLALVALLHVPQFYVWKEMYGSYLTTPQGPGQMRYGHPMVLEWLFAPRNGWLSTHPIAYLGTLGLVAGMVWGRRLGEHARLVCGALLLAIVGQVYFNAITYEWWSAASFGQRRMCSVTLPLVVGLAALLRLVHLWVKRVPTWARHALAVLVLGYFIAWNLAWVSKLAKGKPAGRDNTPTCCKDVPAPLAWIAKPIYARLGNPFELPASAYFAVRHGVSLRRWDQTVGMYALVPPVLGYLDGSYRRATGVWNLTDESGGRYLLDGWGPPQRNERPFRWTTARTAAGLLPILMPEPHRVTVPLAANAAAGETIEVVVRCNGREVARVQVGPTWTDVVFDTDGSIGENVIAFEAEVRPYRGEGAAPARPPTGVPVGVAVGTWRIGLPPVAGQR